MRKAVGEAVCFPLKNRRLAASPTNEIRVIRSRLLLVSKPLARACLNSDIGGLFLTLSSSGLGHRPFTAVTRVRIPLGSPLLLISFRTVRWNSGITPLYLRVRLPLVDCDRFVFKNLTSVLQNDAPQKWMLHHRLLQFSIGKNQVNATAPKHISSRLIIQI